jgi:P3 major capsid protein
MAGLSVAQLRQMDDAYTRLILTNGEELMQSIASGSFTPNGSNNTVTVPMRAVGLCRGFLVKVTASFTNSAANAAAFTGLGPANLLSNFTVTDLDNYQRINTAGYHMNALNTAKEAFPFGAALLSTAMDSPVGYGNNMNVIKGTVPAISSGTAGAITMYYYVPLAYGKQDLRGALFTGVTNATGYLAFTFNPTPYVAKSGADPTLAVYTDAAGGSAAAIVQGVVTYNVYQCYIDQLPKYTSGPAAGAPILPPLSIRTQYRLFNTSLTGVSANTDFPIPFTNFQDFLSATVIYDQNGTLNAGTDITAFKLLAANTLQFFNVDALTQGLKQRIRIKTDFPTGMYQFDFRDAPISTNQAGNIQLTITPSSAAAGTQVLVGWESFARVDTVLGAQSLAAS